MHRFASGAGIPETVAPKPVAWHRIDAIFDKALGPSLDLDVITVADVLVRC
jgi:hypothetical protein